MYLGQESWNRQQQGGQNWNQQQGGQQSWNQGGQQQQWGQQQQQQQQQQQWGQQQQKGGYNAPAAGGAAGEVGNCQRLNITGCKHEVVGPIIRGEYTVAGQNHGKPAYKKEAQANGLQVMMYFWDERDGAAASGWWIGPQIGGNMVWGHHPNRTSGTPPTSGWQAPHSAAADPSMVVAAVGAAPQQPQQQQQGYGQQAQGKGGGWQQQQQQAPQQQQHQQWNQNQGKGQQKGKDSWGQQQQPQQQQKGGWDQQQQKGGWGQQQQQGKGGNSWGQQQQGKGGNSWGQQQQGKGGWGQQQSWEDKRAAMEVANKARLEEQQRKIAEQKAKQEELAKKKAEEMKKRQEDLKKAQGEQQAAMGIRKVIQKFKTVNADGFPALKEELATLLASDLAKCGAHQTKVNQESDQALETAGKRIEQIKAMEIKRKEAIAKAEGLLQELVGMAESADAAVKDLTEKAAKFAGEANLDTEQKVNVANSKVETASASALEQVGACQEFLKTHSAELRVLPMAPKKTPLKPGEKKEGEAEAEQADEKPTLPKIQQQVGAFKMTMDKETRNHKTAFEAALRKAAACGEMKVIKAAFSKHDKDKDGHLNRKEIAAFAKAECSFKMPEAAIDMIYEAMVTDGAKGKGVKEEDFHRLKMSVGIAREMARDADKRKERMQHEEQVAQQKTALAEKIATVAAVVKTAEAEMTEVSKTTRSLFVEAKTLKATGMLARGEEVEGILSAAQEKIDTAQKKVTDFVGEEEEVAKELTKWFSMEKTKLQNQLRNVTTQMSKATSTLTKFKEDAGKKDLAEVKMLSIKVMSMLKGHQKDKEFSVEALFKDITKTDEITAEQFAPYCAKVSEAKRAAEQAEFDKAEGETKKTAEAALTEADLTRVFATIDEEKTGAVTLETFGAILRVLMKVVKDVAITEDFSIKDTKTVRRLEVGEVVEVLEGPKKEDAADLTRVRAKALSDGQEGWITTAGNAGSVFMKEGGGTWKVVKETILTEGFEIDASKEEARKIKETTRKLKPGELLELREWGRKQEATGITRMKCKVKSDGLVGYVTTLGNTGIKFVEIA